MVVKDDIVNFEVPKLLDVGVKRERCWFHVLSGQLLLQRLQMIDVNVKVTVVVNEVTRLHITYMGDHSEKEGVTRNIERDAEAGIT